jgi:hypothetical protein
MSDTANIAIIKKAQKPMKLFSLIELLSLKS